MLNPKGFVQQEARTSARLQCLKLKNAVTKMSITLLMCKMFQKVQHHFGMAEEKNTKTTLSCQFFSSSGTFSARRRNHGPKNTVSVASPGN